MIQHIDRDPVIGRSVEVGHPHASQTDGGDFKALAAELATGDGGAHGVAPRIKLAQRTVREAALSPLPIAVQSLPDPAALGARAITFDIPSYNGAALLKPARTAITPCLTTIQGP
jgi:hypothetical protein